MSAAPSTLTKAQEALVEVMAHYKHEMTQFEADLWDKIFRMAPEQAVLAWLQQHILSSEFRPQPSQAAQALALNPNSSAAFQALERSVASVGSYSAPTLHDPVLIQTIHNLGGWAAVCEQLPAPGADYAYRAFKERFDAAHAIAVGEVRVRGVSPAPLLALGQTSAQQLIAQRPQAQAEASPPAARFLGRRYGQSA